MAHVLNETKYFNMKFNKHNEIKKANVENTLGVA